MQDKDLPIVLSEVEKRVMSHCGRSSRAVERALFDTLYMERQRLDKKKSKGAQKQLAVYNQLSRQATKATPEEQREMLRGFVKRFGGEVAGHFDPRIYGVATRVVPSTLTVLLNTLSPLKLVQAVPGGLETLHDQMEIQGETEAFRKVAGQGTTVLVCTHQSNLDSIVLGFAIFRLGLPPFTYGAGLNLFSNKLIGFFMHNLGAYKVDRLNKADLYKEVLKTYAGCTMERGYHNMFFPGGTRSRSGSVEQKLKLGLLGMGLDAYIHNMIAGKESPDIFVVPCTINYELILEAETLIDDYLKDVGKSRYIITDDEFSKPRVVLEFVRKLFSLNSTIHLTVGRPLDVFGNEVDEQGVSIDRRGRVIDRRRYVFRDGRPAFDHQRDAEYTRELARSIVESFHANTVIKPTNLVCYSIFRLLEERNPEMDVYRLLRTGGAEDSLELPEAYGYIDRTLRSLRAMARKGRIKLDPTLKNRDSLYLVGEALAHLDAYHTRPALVRRGDRFYPVDMNLILYYHNRLVGFDLDGAKGARS